MEAASLFPVEKRAPVRRARVRLLLFLFSLFRVRPCAVVFRPVPDSVRRRIRLRGALLDRPMVPADSFPVARPRSRFAGVIRIALPANFGQTQFLMKNASIIFMALLGSASSAVAATSILVSVPDQKLALVRDGERVAEYRISTSRFGIGDKPRSYATPLGKLEVADRIGEGLPEGAVLKGRSATGEVLPANARGRDPIVTRILHLRGLESRNENAFNRGIYIHGTPAEKTLGKPDSWGCIRMRSQDIVALFDAVPVGTTVEIVEDKMRQALPPVLAATKSAPDSRTDTGLIAQT